MNPAPTSGAPSATRPANGAPVVKRKKPTSDPFFSGPKTRVPAARAKAIGNPGPQQNGKLDVSQPLQSNTPNSQRSISPVRQAPPAERVSGFTDPQVVNGQIPYRDYRVVTTKKELLDGLRFHILQLTGDGPVDIRNEAEFPKPARLLRRDPRATAPTQTKEEGFEAKDGLRPEEREELNKRKEQRQKEREANLAQIAPSQTTAKKVPNFKKKVQQVFRPELSEQDKKRIQLNYEEKLPWHLEDFESSKCFVGHNQVGSANTHAAFVQETAADGTAVLRMIPVEKVYQFSLKKKPVEAMSIEEAEAMMKRRGTEPEWLIQLRHERIKDAQQETEAKKSRGLFSGAQVSSIAGRQGEEADLDFDEDFADDEEGFINDDKDEDEKLADKKIKEDLLTANIFDLKDIKEYDAAEEKEKREEEEKKRNNKRIRKALEKRERNYTLASDSEYSSDTDSEEERERLEQERLNNIKKEEEGEDGKKSNLPSGTNTPSGRKEKHSGAASDREGGMKKSVSNRSLKRPGSPILSDASGTDTSVRKKHKSRHLASSQPTPGTSRPHSPANVPGSSALLNKPKRKGGAGSGSDTEMGGMQSDRDGGAMSDSNRARRPPVNSSLAPSTSRQTSPIPANAAASISRPTSTDPAARSPSASEARETGMVTAPTAQDIRNVINAAPGGKISIPDFLKHFKMNRSNGVSSEAQAAFTALMKQMTSMDKATKKLYLK